MTITTYHFRNAVLHAHYVTGSLRNSERRLSVKFLTANEKQAEENKKKKKKKKKAGAKLRVSVAPQLEEPSM